MAEKNKYRFSHGRLILDDNSRDEAEIIQQFTSSNGTTIYTAIRWKVSQLSSCNCPGWKFNKETGCKHSRRVAIAEMSNYVGIQPGLLGATAPLEAGQRQARIVTFDGNDSE